MSKAEWDGGISSRMREAIASAGSSAGVSKNSVIIAAVGLAEFPFSDLAMAEPRPYQTPWTLRPPPKPYETPTLALSIGACNLTKKTRPLVLPDALNLESGFGAGGPKYIPKPYTLKFSIRGRRTRTLFLRLTLRRAQRDGRRQRRQDACSKPRPRQRLLTRRRRPAPQPQQQQQQHQLR